MDEFSRHEALDRLNLFAQNLGLFLLEHDFVKSHEPTRTLVQEAHDKLMDAYQALGVEHLVPRGHDTEEGEQGLPFDSEGDTDE